MFIINKVTPVVIIIITMIIIIIIVNNNVYLAGVIWILFLFYLGFIWYQQKHRR